MRNAKVVIASCNKSCKGLLNSFVAGSCAIRNRGCHTPRAPVLLCLPLGLPSFAFPLVFARQAASTPKEPGQGAFGKAAMVEGLVHTGVCHGTSCTLPAMRACSALASFLGMVQRTCSPMCNRCTSG